MAGGAVLAVGTLAERLRARGEEIEQTILTRVYAVEDPSQIRDPEYALGLKEAVRSGISYGLSALAGHESSGRQIPSALLSQARRAARSGVGLDTVLRRYVAGHTLLDDFIAQEAESAGLGQSLTQSALRAEAVLLDRLIGAVASEYNHEVETRLRSGRQRGRAECVKQLLGGELADVGELDYDLRVWHLGAVASGTDAEWFLRTLARASDRRLLLVSGDGGTAWGWFGGSRRPDADKLAQLAFSVLGTADVKVSLGEAGRGLAGWRLTHYQASAALPIARRRSRGLTRYAEVGLLASLLRDETLLASMEDLYLAPLADERNGGDVFVETLSAYFAAERNVASAAAILGVARQTVASRLQVIEGRLGRRLAACAVELEIALKLRELSDDCESSSLPPAICHIAEAPAGDG